MRVNQSFFVITLLLKIKMFSECGDQLLQTSDVTLPATPGLVKNIFKFLNNVASISSKYVANMTHKYGLTKLIFR